MTMGGHMSNSAVHPSPAKQYRMSVSVMSRIACRVMVFHSIPSECPKGCVYVWTNVAAIAPQSGGVPLRGDAKPLAGLDTTGAG
jgi:hypothetical protein